MDGFIPTRQKAILNKMIHVPASLVRLAPKFKGGLFLLQPTAKFYENHGRSFLIIKQANHKGFPSEGNNSTHARPNTSQDEVFTVALHLVKNKIHVVVVGNMPPANVPVVSNLGFKSFMFSGRVHCV